MVATDESFRNKKKGVPAGDNSDRGLGGNQAYRNTESAVSSGHATGISSIASCRVGFLGNSSNVVFLEML